ncbi:hypothetical protein BH10PSE17_BH10PSE17_24000 [soil metagenome]
MAKYGEAASKKVETVMREKNAGTLKSGSGDTVTSRKQAIAIALSEARKAGAKVPAKKAPVKKAPVKKAVAKKAVAKKAAAKKTVAKKATAKKTAAKR